MVVHRAERLPVVLLHRHEVVRDALALRLDSERDLSVVASVATSSQAVHAFSEEPRALVLMEEQTPGPNGFELVSELRNIEPTLRVVMLVESEELHLVVAAIRAGVAGIVRSHTPASVLVDAVRTVAAGACVLDHDALVEPGPRVAGRTAQPAVVP